MRVTFNVIKRKALKKAIQKHYNHYTAATALYNAALYDHKFELIEHALTYHMNMMNDLKELFKLLEPIEERVDLLDIENWFFKTRDERLILDNYYALQELRELYKEIERQYYTLKTFGLSLTEGDENDSH